MAENSSSGGKSRRVLCRFSDKAAIQLLCASEDDAASLWRAIYPAIRLWEDGYGPPDTPADFLPAEPFSDVT